VDRLPLNAQSYHLLNLIGHGSALFAIASTAPFIASHEPRRRSGPTLERFCARR
jgi:hypothetical protein